MLKQSQKLYMKSRLVRFKCIIFVDLIYLSHNGCDGGDGGEVEAGEQVASQYVSIVIFAHSCDYY